jgi:light-regulated signal transduction histidine kinase (bacteriophytochrome)
MHSTTGHQHGRTTAELEELAHAVSHDLAQPLTTIAGFARLLISRYDIDIDAKGHEYLEYIVKGATDMQEMIDGLVTSLRAAAQEPQRASQPETSRQAVAA